MIHRRKSTLVGSKLLISEHRPSSRGLTSSTPQRHWLCVLMHILLHADRWFPTWYIRSAHLIASYHVSRTANNARDKTVRTVSHLACHVSFMSPFDQFGVYFILKKTRVLFVLQVLNDMTDIFANLQSPPEVKLKMRFYCVCISETKFPRELLHFVFNRLYPKTIDLSRTEEQSKACIKKK